MSVRDFRGFALCFAVSALLVAAIGLVAWRMTVSFSSAVLDRDALRIGETITLYGIFGWLLGCLALTLVASFGAELRSRQRQTAVNHRGFYRREAGAELLVLVPSYREEAETIWQTLMSVALAEHPLRDVLLLIDDPDQPSSGEHARLLADARALPGQFQAMFDAAAAPFEHALAAFRDRRAGALSLDWEAGHLAGLYDRAADWLARQADDFRYRHGPSPGHTDRLFCSRILEAPADELRRRAATLGGECPTAADVETEYLRLASLFRVRFGSFERKRYANLSHAPNKAMNLNSYLSLIGGCFCEEAGPTGRRLVACDRGEATLVVPNYEFVVSVDADSLITHDHNIRLLEVMRRPGHERIAIAQSPYTAIPNAPSAIEHAAAASTDGQFFGHQGLAYLDAASWVGASALMRFAALRDIAVRRTERGHDVEVFIKDDILIEDAAATIDLLRRGWKVFHSPCRLSYSATPSDFGALVIQRRRWANGGLLILPRLLAAVVRRPLSPRVWADALIRTPHLTSAATNGAFFSVMMLIPFDDRVVPPWLSLVMLPSLLQTMIDLIRAGYRAVDLVAVQALSVLLVPVNLSGTLQSLLQAISGKQRPFARTPKIAGRTRTPKFYVFAIYAFVSYALVVGLVDFGVGRHAHGALALFNAAVFGYSVVRFLGFRQTLEDIGLVPLIRDRTPVTAAAVHEAAPTLVTCAEAN